MRTIHINVIVTFGFVEIRVRIKNWELVSNNIGGERGLARAPTVKAENCGAPFLTMHLGLSTSTPQIPQ